MLVTPWSGCWIQFDDGDRDGDGYKCNITYVDGDGDIDGAGDSGCSNSLVTDDTNSHTTGTSCGGQLKLKLANNLRFAWNWNHCLQIMTEKCRFVAEHCSANKRDDCFQIYRVFSFWTHFVSFLRGETQFNLRGNGGKQLSTVGQLDILLLTFALFTFCYFQKIGQLRATSHNGFLSPDSLICMIVW